MDIQTLTLLERCDVVGLTLSRTDEGNLFIHPRELLTPALLADIRASKVALIQAVHPYISEQGELVIPTRSPDKFKFWAGGQSVIETLRELNATPEQIARHELPKIEPHRGDVKPRSRKAKA
jgi:hypothetical protein